MTLASASKYLWWNLNFSPREREKSENRGEKLKREKIPLHVTTNVEMFLLFVWWFEDSQLPISQENFQKLSSKNKLIVCALWYNIFVVTQPNSEITSSTVNEKEDKSQ